MHNFVRVAVPNRLDHLGEAPERNQPVSQVHADEQASRRWRGGHETRRDNLINAL